jgi:hypothetical protein
MNFQFQQKCSSISPFIATQQPPNSVLLPLGAEAIERPARPKPEGWPTSWATRVRRRPVKLARLNYGQAAVAIQIDSITARLVDAGCTQLPVKDGVAGKGSTTQNFTLERIVDRINASRSGLGANPSTSFRANYAFSGWASWWCTGSKSASSHEAIRPRPVGNRIEVIRDELQETRRKRAPARHREHQTTATNLLIPRRR